MNPKKTLNIMAFPGLNNQAQKQVYNKYLVNHLDNSVAPSTSLAIAKVCKYFNITSTELKSSNRSVELVQARCIVSHYMRTRSLLSLKKIGNILGGRHHATVKYNLQLYDDLLQFNKPFQKTVNKINL